MKEINIKEIIPIREIDGNKILNSSLIQSIAFKVEYPEVFLQEKEWFNSFQNSLKNFIKLLPDYTIYHTITFSDEDEYQSNYDNCANIIEKSRQFHYSFRGIPKQEDYIVVTFADKELDSSLKSHILNNRKGVFSNAYKDAYKASAELQLEIELLYLR